MPQLMKPAPSTGSANDSPPDLMAPMPTIGKPKYIQPIADASVAAKWVSPPFLFRNVTARIFPLKANMAALTKFCDLYLNQDIPPDIVHFSPTIPYVYLMVLNYGSMSPASVEAQNVGWVAQHEVCFTVPLQRWREEKGKLVFKDWSSVSPFIYVDDQLSLTTGREVYGWNKVTGVIGAGIPLWVDDPRAPTRQFELQVSDFATTNAGQSDALRTLLRIDAASAPSFSGFPPDLRRSWSPLTTVPEAIFNTASLMGDAMDIALAMRVRGYESHRSLAGFGGMASQAARKLMAILPEMGRSLMGGQSALDAVVSGLPSLFTETVTLKQFLNPEDTSLACYQAVVNSNMGVDRLNGFGLAGDVNLLLGDTSGGYAIHLHELDAQPIISTLGLEAGQTEARSSGRVAILKPVLPFWVDMDLYYGKGDVICSRAHGAANEAPRGWWDEQADKDPALKAPRPPPSRPLYNTTLGAATQPISGPFHFPDVTMQVFPLLADRAKIDLLLNSVLNWPLAEKGMLAPDQTPLAGAPLAATGKPANAWRFEACGSYAYMIVTVYGAEIGSMWSAANNIGGFFDREVTFCVPVKWFDENDNLISMGVVEPFTYSNNSRAVATDREINGYNTIKSTIDSPADPWMTPSGPIAPRRYLHLGTEVIPALNVGAQAEQRTLLEIDARDVLPEDAEREWRTVADTWSLAFIEDLKRKTFLAYQNREQLDAAKALALEMLAHGAPLNRIVLKQYRDGENLDSACYQALVQASSAITSIYDVREIDSPLHVRVHRWAGHPIVDVLGLKVKYEQSADGDVVDILQPVRPFWMRLGMREDLGTLACYRWQDTAWRIVHPWFETRETRSDPGAPRRRLDGETPYFRQSGPTRVGAWLARVPETPATSRPTAADLQSLLDPKTLDAWFGARLDSETFGADLHRDIKNKSAVWVRRSLSNQLTWIRLGLEALPDAEAKAGFLGGLKAPTADAGVAALFACDLTPGSIYRFCESRSAQDLRRIRNALDEPATRWALLDPASLADIRAGEEGDGKDEGARPAAASEPIELADGSDLRDSVFYKHLSLVAPAMTALLQASASNVDGAALVWGWEGYLDSTITAVSLMDSMVKIASLPGPRAQAFLLLFPGVGMKALADLSEYAQANMAAVVSGEDPTIGSRAVDFARLNVAISKLREAKILSRWVEEALLDWVAPSRWLPISHAAAAAAMRGLEEIQLVIDNILSSEWEARGVTRWEDEDAGRKPDQFVPTGPDIRRVAAAQELEPWIDPERQGPSGLWVAPRLGPNYLGPPDEITGETRPEDP